MNTIIKFCFVWLIICSALTTTITTTATTSLSTTENNFELETLTTQIAKELYEEDKAKDSATLTQETNAETSRPEEGRSIAGHYEVNEDYGVADKHANLKKRAKPLKNIFMGIYKNYKSTYLGNKTTTEYKQSLRERITNSEADEQVEPQSADSNHQHAVDDNDNGGDEENITLTTIIPAATESIQTGPFDTNTAHLLTQEIVETQTASSIKKRRKRKHKHRPNSNKKKHTQSTTVASNDETQHHEQHQNTNDYHNYTVGAGVNMSLDMNNDIIKVQLNADNLREIFHGRWLSDNSEEGRAKKYDMVTKVLPLFVIPFLIQSAIVPFLVTKLKLLLIKSILVGKLAIFLLVLSAIKNSSNKSMQSYEVAPSYWAGEPSRRSELAALASSAGFNGSGYRVEGKPVWIN